MEELKFSELQKAIMERLATTPKFADCKTWNALEWAGALCGEAGELANFAKKQVRGDGDKSFEIIKEAADVVIYASLLAGVLGYDLGTIVRAKFNEVSDRVNSDVRL